MATSFIRVSYPFWLHLICLLLDREYKLRHNASKFFAYDFFIHIMGILLTIVTLLWAKIWSRTKIYPKLTVVHVFAHKPLAIANEINFQGFTKFAWIFPRHCNVVFIQAVVWNLFFRTYIHRSRLYYLYSRMR